MQSIHKNKRKKNIFIYIVIIIIFIIINPFNIFGSIRNIIMVPLTPVLQFSFGSGSKIAEYTGAIFHIGTLYSENKSLIVQIRNLESQNALLHSVKNENEILRGELNLPARDIFEVNGAEVVLRDSLGGDQWIMINKGTNDGIEVDKAVLVGDNILVGVVDEVNKNTSRVKLITHSESIINIVSDKTDDEAIAYGDHGLSVRVNDIKKDAKVSNGDMFITSNIGNNLPKGLSVGIVHDLISSDNDLFQSAHIEPLVKLDDLQFVFVIK